MIKSKLLRISAISIALAGTIIIGGTTAANAATYAPSSASPKTIAPGDTGSVVGQIANPYGSSQTGNVTLTLTAPAHSTFTSTTVMGTATPGGGSSSTSAVFQNCTLSNANTQMVCSGSLTVPAAGNSTAGYLALSAQIQVDSTAASSTTYTATNGFNLTGGGQITGGAVNLTYKTPAAVATPIIAPAIGASALGLALIITAALYIRRRHATV